MHLSVGESGGYLPRRCASVDFRFSSINYVFGENECEYLRQKVFYSRLVSPAASEQPKLKRDPQQTLYKSINYKPHWWRLLLDASFFPFSVC